MGMNDINSLSHTKWNCKYHIVFAPKYRRKVFYKEKRAAVGKILRQLCEWKGVKVIEAEACPDHIHLFVEIPPKMAVSSFMGYLKGKSSTMLYEQFGELKYKFRNREFWCRGYYVHYKIGKLQIQGFSEPTTPKNKITELSHYAEGRPVKTTGGLFAWKARKEAEIF